jgi:hypothetical protein
VDSLYGAIAKLVEAGVNISPIVDVSMYPASARWMGGSPVAFYYFMAPANDPDVAEVVNQGMRRNVAHYCPDTGALVIETGMRGLGRDCGVEHDRTEDIGKTLLPLLVRPLHGSQLVQHAEAHALQRSASEPDEVFHVMLGYRAGRLCAYVARDDEQPGPSDCKHLIWRSYTRGGQID